MNDLCVIAGTSPAYTFVGPQQVLRSESINRAQHAFSLAEQALSAGYWIAGYITYEGAVCFGVFEAPRQRDVSKLRAPFRMSRLQPTISRDHYDAAIQRIRHAIYEGDVYQVNYTVPFTFSFEGDPADAFLRLTSPSGARYNAFVRDGDRALLSFSPELFLDFNKTHLITKPMKGTAPTDRIDELDSDKNRAEHLMIVDLLRNDLYRAGLDVSVEKLFEVERYPTFATMTSTIVGTVQTAWPSLEEIFTSVFPCGSVTGAPKVAAMQQIAMLEGRNRSAYCGTIGFLSPQRTGWWNVAIRTAQLDYTTGTGRYDAGGGIVSDSTAEMEWAEVLLKTHVFQQSAEPFEILETFRPADMDEHLARLQKTAEHFGIRYAPLSMPIPDEDVIVRLRLRSDGTSSYRIEPFRKQRTPVSICIADERVHSSDPMLRWKTSWRPKHERAFTQAQETGCFDALLLNERGEVTEGTRTNLFVRIGGVLHTPPLSCGLLPGILRERLIREKPISERVLYPADLARAEELYIGNSARGLMQATLLKTLTTTA